MFEDVLDALSRANEHLAGIAVVTADPDAALLAERHNAIVVSDEGCDDINLAIRLGIEAIVKRGAGGVLVIPSDIPHLSPEAVAEAVAAIEVPSRSRPSRQRRTGAPICSPVGRRLWFHCASGRAVLQSTASPRAPKASMYVRC